MARPKTATPNEVYTSSYAEFTALTDGFLSGANLEDSSHRYMGEFTDSTSRMLWLENFCRANPLASFVESLTALRKRLNQPK